MEMSWGAVSINKFQGLDHNIKSKTNHSIFAKTEKGAQLTFDKNLKP